MASPASPASVRASMHSSAVSFIAGVGDELSMPYSLIRVLRLSACVASRGTGDAISRSLSPFRSESSHTVSTVRLLPLPVKITEECSNSCPQNGQPLYRSIGKEPSGMKCPQGRVVPGPRKFSGSEFATEVTIWSPMVSPVGVSQPFTSGVQLRSVCERRAASAAMSRSMSAGMCSKACSNFSSTVYPRPPMAPRKSLRDSDIGFADGAVVGEGMYKAL